MRLPDEGAADRQGAVARRLRRAGRRRLPGVNAWNAASASAAKSSTTAPCRSQAPWPDPHSRAPHSSGITICGARRISKRPMSSCCGSTGLSGWLAMVRRVSGCCGWRAHLAGLRRLDRPFPPWRSAGENGRRPRPLSRRLRPAPPRPRRSARRASGADPPCPPPVPPAGSTCSLASGPCPRALVLDPAPCRRPAQPRELPGHRRAHGIGGEDHRLGRCDASRSRTARPSRTRSACSAPGQRWRSSC